MRVVSQGIAGAATAVANAAKHVVQGSKSEFAAEAEGSATSSVAAEDSAASHVVAEGSSSALAQPTAVHASTPSDGEAVGLPSPAASQAAGMPPEHPPPAHGSWVEGEGYASGIDWAALRAQWCRARGLFREMHETYARTVSADDRADDGASAGLQKLTKLLLLVAKQQLSSRQGERDLDQLGATLGLGGLDHQRLFQRPSAPTAAQPEATRKVEQEVLDLVAARISPQHLKKIIIKQQSRAYSRAAGYRAACELLVVCEGSPRLQCKLLSELVTILRPAATDGKATFATVTHYSRGVECAGAHASGRLRLAFAALVKQLVKLLGVEHAPSDRALSLQSLWSMRCLLHMEMREEDIPVQQAVGLLPALNDVVSKLHGRDADSDLARPSGSVSGGWEAAGDGRESKLLPRTVQLVYHTLVSRFVVVRGKDAKGPSLLGLTRSTGSTLRGRAATAADDAALPDDEAVWLQTHMRDIEAAASHMRTILDSDVTPLGANTGSDGWMTSERFLYGSLALLFQLSVCRKGFVKALADDRPLGALFGALHVGSLRCARLVLRLLSQVLALRSLVDLPASLLEAPPPLASTPGAGPSSWGGAATSSSASAEDGASAGGLTMPPILRFLLTLIADQLVDEGGADGGTLLSSRVLWRPAQTKAALASEAAVLVRRLAQLSGFEKVVCAAFEAIMLCLPSVVESLKADPTGSQLASSGLRGPAMLNLGALCVLEGSMPSLLVGGRVAAEVDAAADMGGRQEGVLVKWDGAEDSEALVLLDSQLHELQLLSVSALQLLPIDEAPLPLGAFPISSALTECFRPFMPKNIDSRKQLVVLPSALQTSFLFGLLQTRVLKALQGLLKHPASMRVALDGGLLPAIMASAATPVPLLGIHHTDTLQTLLASLEQMHVEASTAARMAKLYVAHTRRRRMTTSAAGAVAAVRDSFSRQPAESPGRPSEGANVGHLREQVEMLTSMGFEITLCQKAVGRFGDNMEAAIMWLTDDQAQQEQRRQLQRSPSWQRADDLAQAMGFSVGACKKALEKSGNNPNIAASWLLDHGAAAEAEADTMVDAQAEVVEFTAPLSSSSSDPLAASSTEDDDEGLMLKTVSFRPGAHVPMPALPKPRRSTDEGGSRQDLLDEPAQRGPLEADEFRSAAPPSQPPLPEESTLDLATRENAAPRLLSRLHSRQQTLVSSADSASSRIKLEECLLGRLLRPTPLLANRNAVLSSAPEGDEANASLELTTRLAETDVLERKARHLRMCQRAEASLAGHFPELAQLGANSSGLDAVSGAAHTALAIMLLRQAVLYLLADMEGLQHSHEDARSAFDLEQLGQPRDLLDLLKLAYHSSGGGASVGGSPFAKLWSLMEGLVRADGDDAVQLPAPFKALPRLLRDDALKHLRRELGATAMLQSSHPLTSSKLSGNYPLRLPGASQITLHLDARSSLGAPSSSAPAQLIFCADEEGANVIARWAGSPSGWINRTVLGDTLWVRLVGEVPKKEVAKKPWGFSVRITASAWLPPDEEVHALEAPLSIGWQLLELLCEHRPIELLTVHTFRAIVRYLHTEDAPHRAVAAALLLRLLKLPASALPPEMLTDPRDAWPMDSLLALTKQVEWHAANAVDRVSGLLAPHAQLYAELVAQAHMRASPGQPGPVWMAGVTELSAVANYLLQPERELDSRVRVPARWSAVIRGQGLNPGLLDTQRWSVSMHAALVKQAASMAAANKTKLLAEVSWPTWSLPRAARGPLSDVEDNEAIKVHFALLQQFNHHLQSQMAYVFTGYADRPHTLGAQLCELRDLIFPEVKLAKWTATLDAVAIVRDNAYNKEHPPPAITVNRHRAAKEREDRRARMQHTVFAQLHDQIQFVPRSRLQRRDRAFKVKFAGEGADDYGGPYREVFTCACSELQNQAALPMFLLTPNGQINQGSNRDRYVIDPSSTTPEALKWFEFLGVLIAICLLQKETVLSLNLCSVLWKQLVQQPRTATDLEAFDERVCHSLYKIRDIEDEGIDEDSFEDLFFLEFTTQLSNGDEVEVCEGGSALEVTFQNRKRYVEMVLKKRLVEGHAQTHAILRGVASMVPVRLLPLFTHAELERMICGAPDIDIGNLRRHTRYGVSVDPQDSHIALLWRVLEFFTPEQRSKFLTFIWGRNRLPQTDEEWGDQCMKVHTLEAAPADGHFPVSHTCFFSMEWPRYTSFEIAREKLLYAIINWCAPRDPPPSRPRPIAHFPRTGRAVLAAPTWTWTRLLKRAPTSP